MRLALPLLLALGLALPCEAQTLAGVTTRVGASVTYTGPGDVVAGASGFYSAARAYISTKAFSGYAKGASLINTVSSEVCDEHFTTKGLPDNVFNCSGASENLPLATFCTGGCKVITLYDQTGVSQNITQTTAANRPTLVVVGLGSLPHLSMATSGTGLVSASNFTPATGTVSVEHVAQRSAGAGNTTILFEENGLNNVIETNAANTWILAASASFTATAADASWHAATSVINNTTSSINVDGTRTTGSTGTLKTTAGLIKTGGATATTYTFSELGFWDNVAFTTGNQTSLCQNAQAAYGGGGNFGATC